MKNHIYIVRLLLLSMLMLALSSAAWAKGTAFINSTTGTSHKFVAANYTDLGANPDGSMPSNRTTLENNAIADLNRLAGLGVTNVRVWAPWGYGANDYNKMANRVSWLATLAQARNMTLTVDLFDSSGNNTLANLQNNEAHINNMINQVIGANSNKSHILWSLGNEIGGHENPLGFASFYEGKVSQMRNAGAKHISFQPVPGSLEHRWNGDTREAAIRVINVSDDISVHFYAAGALANEPSVNWLEFSSMQQWVNLAHQRCKPTIIGEFGISNIGLRTDANIAEWLNYFENTLKVDQVSFWQFTKDEAGHVDPQCFCDTAANPYLPGNGTHVSAMNGYLGSTPNYPSDSNCGSTPPPPTGVNFQTGRDNPVSILANHQQYLSSENGNAYVNANRNALGPWEKFYIYANNDGTYSIQGNNDRYLDLDRSGGHRLRFNNTNRYCGDCKFYIEHVGGDVYGIKPVATNFYMSSENGAQEVRANRTALHAWEKWTIKNISGSVSNWKTLTSNGELNVGQAYYSNNSQYRLVMQGDGNLVLYRSDNVPMWHSHTYGNSGSRCFMQGDGNLVIYSPQGHAIWHTHTYGNSGAVLQISNTGKIRIRHNGQTLWQS